MEGRYTIVLLILYIGNLFSGMPEPTNWNQINSSSGNNKTQQSCTYYQSHFPQPRHPTFHPAIIMNILNVSQNW